MSAGTPALSRRRLLTIAPLAVTVVAGAGFWAMLAGMRQGSFDPHDVHASARGRAISNRARSYGWSTSLLPGACPA